jgi:hypothetical protein
MEYSGYPHAPVDLPSSKIPVTHPVERWVGHRAGTDIFGGETQKVLPVSGFEPRIGTEQEIVT